MENKKLFFIGCLFLCILVISSSDYLMKCITDEKFNVKNVFHSDRFEYGDLYGFSYLSDYRHKRNFINPIQKINNAPKKINLFVVGDSFLEKEFITSKNIFNSVNDYKFLRHNSNDKLVFELDTSKENVLLIETVERNLREFKKEDYIKSKFFRKDNLKKEVKKISLGKIYYDIEGIVFNKKIENYIEFNLFDYSFFSPIKEIKADITKQYFNRINSSVTILSNKKYLYLSSTIDKSSLGSSFLEFKQKEVDEIVNTINNLNFYYKTQGFDRVYFSIIPNTVTITEKYLKNNQIISKIEKSPILKAPLIRIYNKFIVEKKQIYFYSDTHWNINGFNLWLNIFNNELSKKTK